MSHTDSRSRQRVRYLRSRDGIQLAWAEAGEGPPLVKAANWLTHLEYEWESPVWQHWIRFFSDHFRYIRYDERGCGMSERAGGELTVERWVGDLEDVITAAAPAEPFALLGISQGSAMCIAYAVKYPERVSHLLLYGGYARGVSRRRDAAHETEYRAIIDLVRAGWGRDNPAFRRIFTSRFLPRGTDEQLRWFDELCLKTTTAEIAAQLLEARATIDVSDLLERVRVPTLVVHARNDVIVPIAEGRLLAERIPGAQFVELDSENHVLLAAEPAWERFREAALDFLGGHASSSDEDPLFRSLSPREREVFALMTDGLSNAEIGERLTISEKTVRNHVSRVFDKLGVWTRAQAIVLARDRGFR
jgi:pimeloyl-ACP methyl ester carboxylesterase/DNA-binding CsgD family transcriptional regulator